jgi:hypothetical protein
VQTTQSTAEANTVREAKTSKQWVVPGQTSQSTAEENTVRELWSQGNGNGSGNVNGFGGRGNGSSGNNIRGVNRGNGRGARGQTQPVGSSFQQQQQQQQQNFQLPPSMQQALINSLPPAFLQQYAAANTEWNGGSEDNPVNLDENSLY